MNKMQFIRVVKSLIIFQFFTHYAGLAASERPSVLDPSQHPQSEIYQPIFSDTIQPLDNQLSWTKRFNGDETFNTSETLQLNSTEVAKSAPSTAMEPESMTGMKMDGQGVIKGLQVERGKVKISHGPIDKYGMPAMTMVFKVEDAAMLEGLKKNQKIGFDVDNSSGGFVVTHIMPMSMMEEAASQKTLVKMDVRGMVKAVRESQGKVKIKHGPIEKYGMPAMTMMFKVADPAMLEGLKKNQQIDFNIDNASGGFVVTRIRPLSQMDAKGVVQAVSGEQGKIKIKHGPIDKYGMPAMTMMFKVSDPAQLSGLQKGNSIEFNIDNSSGGFVVTKISAVNPSNAGESQNGLCFSTGPFKEKTRALEVRDRYAANSIKSELKSSSAKTYVGTMVYLPGHATRQEALNTVEALKQKGIQDFQIISEPGKSNAVSLGVFGSQKNADRRMQEIQNLNYPVKSESRYRQGNVYWLYSRGSNASDLNSLLDPDDASNGISQEPRQCA